MSQANIDSLILLAGFAGAFVALAIEGRELTVGASRA